MILRTGPSCQLLPVARRSFTRRRSERSVVAAAFNNARLRRGVAPALKLPTLIQIGKSTSMTLFCHFLIYSTNNFDSRWKHSLNQVPSLLPREKIASNMEESCCTCARLLSALAHNLPAYNLPPEAPVPLSVASNPDANRDTARCREFETVAEKQQTLADAPEHPVNRRLECCGRVVCAQCMHVRPPRCPRWHMCSSSC